MGVGVGDDVFVGSGEGIAVSVGVGDDVGNDVFVGSGEGIAVSVGIGDSDARLAVVAVALSEDLGEPSS